MKTLSKNNLIIRNAAALWLRFYKALKNKDSDGLAVVGFLIIAETLWLLSLASSPFVLLMGFWKRQCFVLGLLLFFVAGMIRANIEDSKDYGK